jgi:hypothetical protein
MMEQPFSNLSTWTIPQRRFSWVSDMHSGLGPGPSLAGASLNSMRHAAHVADISKVQDDEVGDGTTSVVVFAGELLREAELLVNQKVHPMTIIAGEADRLGGRPCIGAA